MTIWIVEKLPKIHTIFIFTHIVEKYHKTRSRFLRKNQHFFREIKKLLFEEFVSRISRFLTWSRYLVCSTIPPQCGKTKNSLPRKYFSVKSTFLLIMLLKSWFHGNFWAWSRIIVLSTLDQWHGIALDRRKFRNCFFRNFVSLKQISSVFSSSVTITPQKICYTLFN